MRPVKLHGAVLLAYIALSLSSASTGVILLPRSAIVVGDHERLGVALRHAIEGVARAAQRAGRRVALAVPGGSVVTTLLPSLQASGITWRHTDLYWCDERAGPLDGPDSNVALSRAGWLSTDPARRATQYPMPADAADLAAAATQYAELLHRQLGTPPVLDGCILGMGPDGHVASLFPGASGDDASAAAVRVVRDAPKAPPVRLTLSMECLAVSRLVVVAAFGAEKRHAIHEALTDVTSVLPVAQLLRRSARALVLLDPEAASELAPSRSSGSTRSRDAAADSPSLLPMTGSDAT